MVRKEYSAGGVKHPFWFLEFKKAPSWRDQGVRGRDSAPAVVRKTSFLPLRLPAPR